AGLDLAAGIDTALIEWSVQLEQVLRGSVAATGPPGSAADAAGAPGVPTVPGVPAVPYVVHNGRICTVSYDEDGRPAHQPLCNFDARIVAQVLIDDGAEPRGELEI